VALLLGAVLGPAALAAPAAAGAPGRPAAGPLTPGAWVARLDQARQLAEAGAAAPSPKAMGTVRQTLGLPVDVVIGGSVLHIPPDPYLKGLDGARAQQFLHAADHLAALEDAARAALAVRPASPGRLQAALEAAYAGINPRPGLADRIRHDLWVTFLTVWHTLYHAVRKLPLPTGIIQAIAAVMLAGVVVYLVSRARAIVPEPGEQGAHGRQHKANPVDWDRLAEQALARGDLEAAVRARYHALLAILAARGAIPQVPSLTAGECRRAVARNLPAAYPAVARATSIFESTVYGRAPAHKAEVDALQEAEQMVRAA
jgi:hypothetical protein